METLQRGIDAGAQGASLHHVLGMLLAQDGRPSEATASLKRALELEPNRGGGLRLQLAQLVRSQGDEAEAMALLQAEIKEPGGETRNARLLLAQMHLDAERPNAAKPLVDAVIKENPSDKEALLVAYIIALSSGLEATAEREATIKAIGQRSGVAQVLLEQGFVTEGERLLKEALVKEPQDPLAPVLLSAVMIGGGREAEAIALRSEVLGETPEGPDKERLEALFESAFEQAKAARAQQLEGAAPQAPATP